MINSDFFSPAIVIITRHHDTHRLCVVPSLSFHIHVSVIRRHYHTTSEVIHSVNRGDKSSWKYDIKSKQERSIFFQAKYIDTFQSAISSIIWLQWRTFFFFWSVASNSSETLFWPKRRNDLFWHFAFTASYEIQEKWGNHY